MERDALFSIEVKSGNASLLAPHFHADALEFIQVVKGTVDIVAGLEVITVSEGGIVHLLPGRVHYAVAAEGADCLVRVLTYRTDAIIAAPGLDEQLLSLYILPMKQAAYVFDAQHPLNAFLSAHMETAVSEWRGRELFHTAVILAEVAHMQAAVLRLFGYNEEEGLEYHNRMRIAPTIRHIEACYDKKLRLEDLAATLYLSPDHFGKLFRATVGLTPVEYINYVRVNAAKRLLVSTDMSIAEIAKASGFANANYFHKVFRDFLGRGPAAVRKRLRAVQAEAEML